MTFPAERQGPPGIVNGGWLAGVLAASAGTAESGTVTLRKPTPVGVALTVLADAGSAVLSLEGTDLATLTPGPALRDAPTAVSWEDAETVEPSYIGLLRHPFPGCMVCGSGREATDALCLRPGRLSADVVAAPWQPAPWTDDGTGRVTTPALWAALDCPSAWAIDDEGRAVVLGRISTRILAMPRVEDRLVVVGWVHQRTSRRIAECGSAIYDDNGRVLAVSTSKWFAVDIATFAR